MNKNTKETRADHVWHDTLKALNNLTAHVSGLRKGERMARGAAYDFAVGVIALQEKHHNFLLDMLGSLKKTLDEWLDEGFGLVEQLGEDRRVLMGHIKDGMTRREFAHAGRLWVSPKERQKREGVARDIVVPEGKLEPEEEIEALRAALKAARATIRDQGREIATLHGRLERAERAMARIERTVKQTEKALA